MNTWLPHRGHVSKRKGVIYLCLSIYNAGRKIMQMILQDTTEFTTKLKKKCIYYRDTLCTSLTLEKIINDIYIYIFLYILYILFPQISAK